MGIVQSTQDVKFMRRALKLAKRAALKGEVPVGAVLVSNSGEILATGSNLRETLTTPIGHAEILALHRGAKKIKSWRLEDCTLYVTLEPCLMCAGAIQQSRLGRLVFGAKDAKAGAVQSIYQVLNDERLNHQVVVTSGVLAAECSNIMSQFFKKRRTEIKTAKLSKVYRLRSSALVIHKGKILGFHAVDPTSLENYFFLPGGKIETGETSQEAALRETFEETGYKIKILTETEVRKKYDFCWNGTNYSCETVFYLAILDEEWHEPTQIKDTDYHRGVDWIPLKKAAEVFYYNKEIMSAVQKLLKTAVKRSL